MNVTLLICNTQNLIFIELIMYRASTKLRNSLRFQVLLIYTEAEKLPN